MMHHSGVERKKEEFRELRNVFKFLLKRKQWNVSGGIKKTIVNIA